MPRAARRSYDDKKEFFAGQLIGVFDDHPGTSPATMGGWTGSTASTCPHCLRLTERAAVLADSLPDVAARLDRGTRRA